MADKEPRRRKKRKDLQRKVHFLEDTRMDDQSSILSPKADTTRDSDQDAEDDLFVVPSHQPSKFAKFVFVLLFSGLVVSMSFVFISLQGAERGPIDVSDENHKSEHSESPDSSEESWSSSEKIHDESEDMFGLGDIFPLHEEQIAKDFNLDLKYADTEGVSSESSIYQSFPDNFHEAETEDLPLQSESLVQPNVIEEHYHTSTIDDDHVTDNILFEEAVTESLVQDVHIEPDPTLEIPPEIKHPDPVISQSIPEQPEVIEEFSQSQDFSQPNDFEDLGSESDFHEPPTDELEGVLMEAHEDVLPEVPPHVADPTPLEELKNEFAFYDRSDITNEEDFAIREKLDEIEKVLEKDLSEGADNDDDYDEEEIEDEFDFWQF